MMKSMLCFPRPFRLDLSIGFALLLMISQLATGTSLEFAELTFFALVFAILAVNLAGGLRTLAGCCFAIVALKMFVVAEIAKALCGEPGQSRLQEPLVTMGVQALSMVALCLAAVVCTSFRPKRVLLAPILDPEMLRVMSILSLVIGTGSSFVAQFTGVTEDGGVWIGGGSGVLRRISACAPLAITAGTAYTIITSNGKRLFSLYNALPFCIEFGTGVLFTSKQALFDPFFYVAITGISFGFRWRRFHLICGVLVVLLVLFVLFPFGQVARNYTRGPNIRETYRLTVDFFTKNVTRPTFLFDQYAEYKAGLDEGDSERYFEISNGLLERMSLIKTADTLISATLKQGTSRWTTLGPNLADLVPRMLLPRRFVNVSNELAYKAGVIDEDNLSTCVSFGFAADAFNCFGWWGVGILSFVIGLVLIVLTRWLTSGLENNVWALVFLGAYQVGIAEAPAGGALGIIYQTAWIVSALLLIRLSAQFWLISRRWLGRPQVRGPGFNLPERYCAGGCKQSQ
jgi:hypothetical protein